MFVFSLFGIIVVGVGVVAGITITEALHHFTTELPIILGRTELKSDSSSYSIFDCKRILSLPTRRRSLEK